MKKVIGILLLMLLLTVACKTESVEEVKAVEEVIEETVEKIGELK